MLKAVLMDIDDTLLDFGKCAEQAMRIGFAEWGLPYDDSTYATFTRINDGLWLMIERGELTTQQLFQFRWNRIFEALGIQADGAAFEKRFLDLLYETAIPVDGADEICRYLKKKYILCAASNAFHDQQLNRLEMAGLLPYFDHVFSLTADITGGKNAGMKTIWYNHTHRPVPERCEADQIVESLSELKNLL